MFSPLLSSSRHELTSTTSSVTNIFTKDYTISPCTLANWPTGISMVASTAPIPITPFEGFCSGLCQVQIHCFLQISRSHIQSPDLRSKISRSQIQSRDLGIESRRMPGSKHQMDLFWTPFGTNSRPLLDPFHPLGVTRC